MMVPAMDASQLLTAQGKQPGQPSVPTNTNHPVSVLSAHTGYKDSPESLGPYKRYAFFLVGCH